MVFHYLALIPYLAMILGLHLGRSAWLSFALYHGGILLVMLRPEARHHMGRLLSGWDWRQGTAAIVFGLGGGLLTYALAPIAGLDGPRLAAEMARLGLQGPAWILFALYHALLNPWFEEVFWRGRLGDDRRGLVANDLLFAGYHILVLTLFLDWGWVLLSFLVLTAAGWLWRQMRRARRGLLLPVLSHLAADAGIMAAVYRLIQ